MKKLITSRDHASHPIGMAVGYGQNVLGKQKTHMALLEKVNEVNWESLKHAYGSAKDIPDDLRNLASQDEKIRGKALYNLYGNIFHQGTRYEATPYAIPFLYELIHTEAVRDKHKIVALLINLALGYEEEYLPEGIDVEKFKKGLLESEAQMTQDQKANCEKYGYSASAIINCYDYVKEGIPILLQYLENQDNNLRKSVIYAISWFPELAESSIAKITDQLPNLEEEKEIANAILAIGLLARRSSNESDISGLRKYLNAASQLVRICTAIALAKHPIEKKILEALIDGLISSEALSEVEGIHFNEGRISGYASLTLSKFGQFEKNKIIPVLCKVLETVNSYQALDITHAMLSIINSDRSKPIKDERLEDLTLLEVEALTSIYEHGGWTLAKGGFVNYFQLLRSAGIPDSKEELGKYLTKI